MTRTYSRKLTIDQYHRPFESIRGDGPPFYGEVIGANNPSIRRTCVRVRIRGTQCTPWIAICNWLTVTLANDWHPENIKQMVGVGAREIAVSY